MQQRLSSALDELKVLQNALLEEKKKSTPLQPSLRVETQTTTVKVHSPKKASPLKVNSFEWFEFDVFASLIHDITENCRIW